jgi:hypothetical protein
MSQVTELASASTNGHDTITVELIEADQTPAVVIVRWRTRPACSIPAASPVPLTVLHASSRPQSYGWQRSNGSAGCDRRICLRPDVRKSNVLFLARSSDLVARGPCWGPQGA